MQAGEFGKPAAQSHHGGLRLASTGAAAAAATILCLAAAALLPVFVFRRPLSPNVMLICSECGALSPNLFSVVC